MTPDIETLYGVIDATWAPAAMTQAGPWTIREGQGGGQRVSAATANGPVTEGDLPQAEAAMRALGQTPLFMIRKGDDALDSTLDARGYKVVDPVNLWIGPAQPLADAAGPRAKAYAVWEPLAIQVDMWADGGIGPGRIAVMHRVAGPKTSIIGRFEHTPAATAFVGLHAGVGMIHALEVPAALRRKGVAARACRQAALWTVQNGGTFISALCTQANTGANALYASLGLGVVGQYHYRKLQEDSPS
ncbi:GNAT family N-acetyltransferase [Roseovarius sp.]|uniref:GNAT family N-acetyltransferase n=1 Tax=Roseovarius sp. TaxID=1486281 RepID=UPI00262377EB|nr:GNAT family N-acetyltransferase [Roseovarius sp.]MDM8168791.1 GNAT family N-acetyltransferase [Roseovarius sp.]